MTALSKYGSVSVYYILVRNMSIDNENDSKKDQGNESKRPVDYGQPPKGIEVSPSMLVEINALENGHAKTQAEEKERKKAESAAEWSADTAYKNRLVKDFQEDNGEYARRLRGIADGLIRGATNEELDDVFRLRSFYEKRARQKRQPGGAPQLSSLGEEVAVDIVFPEEKPVEQKPPGFVSWLKGKFKR